MTITIENADKNLVKAVKSVANLKSEKVKVKVKEKGIDKAIKSYEIEKDTLKIYKNFEEFEKDL